MAEMCEILLLKRSKNNSGGKVHPGVVFFFFFFFSGALLYGEWRVELLIFLFGYIGQNHFGEPLTTLPKQEAQRCSRSGSNGS